MKTHVATLALGLCGLMVATVGLSAQGAKKKSVWDGAYTAAQAARGETAYKKSCTSCHRDDLKGNVDGGPPLRGEEFTVRWKGTSMKEMIASISEIMPNSDPGSLPRQTYVDIVTFLLRGNGVPAGSVEMPVKDAELDQIVYAERPKK